MARLIRPPVDDLRLLLGGRNATSESTRSRIDDAIVLIRGIEWFRGLSATSLRDLAVATRVEEFSESEMVYRVGDRANSCFIVAHGRVIVSCYSQTGKMMLTCNGPFSVFGEPFVDSRSQGQTQAQANLDTVLYRIGESDLIRLCHLHGELGVAFARLTAHRWKETCQRLEDVMFLDARQRVLKLLFEFSADDGSRIMSRRNPLLRFTQEELARFVGVTRERMNVILHELEDSAIVELHHRAVRINLPNLERALDEEALRNEYDGAISE